MSDSAGRIALTVVGTAVGTYFGYPALGFTLGSLAGQTAFPGDGPPDGPRLDDLKVQSSAYGAPIPILWGTWRTAGNVIWSAGITEHKEEQGGKGGGGGKSGRSTYDYTASFAVAFGEGPAAGIKKIWADAKVIYDTDIPGGAHHVADQAHEGSAITIYRGTEAQTADPLIEAHEGAGQVPAHRGLVYVVFEDLPLADYGNRIPSITAEIVSGSESLNHSGSYALESKPEFERFQLGTYENGAYTLYRQNNKAYETGSGEVTYQQEQITVDLDGNVVDGPREHDRVSVDWPSNAIVTLRYFTPRRLPDAVDPGLLYQDHTNGNGDKPELRSTTRGRLVPPEVLVIDAGTNTAYENLNSAVATADAVFLSLKASDNPAMLVSSPVYENPLAMGFAEFLFLGQWVQLEADLSGLSATQGASVAWDPEQERLLAYCNHDPDYGEALHCFDKALNRQWRIDGQPLASYESGDGVLEWDVRDGRVLVAVLDYGSSNSISGFDQLVVDYNAPSISFVQEWYRAQPSNSTTGDFGTGGDGEEGKLIFAADGVRHLPNGQAAFSPYYGLIASTWAGQDLAVATVLGDLCERGGLAASDYDASAVTATVTGYAHTRPADVQADLRPLLELFAIDAVESEGVLKFLPRGGSPVATIPEADLGVHAPGEDPPDPVATTRVQELELPKRIGVQHADPGNRYERGEQYAARIVTEAVNDRTVPAPVAITPAQAAAQAQTLLLAAWRARERQAWVTPLKWAYLDPGDVVTVEGPQASHTVRITTTDVAAHGRVRFDSVREDATVYQANATAASAQATSTAGQPVGPTRLAVLDIPLLRDRDNAPGYYIAAAGVLSGWPGARILRVHADATHDEVGSTTQDTPIARTTNALGTARATVWDEGNTVTVERPTASLSSATRREVLDGANHALVGDEIIAYRDAADNGDGTWTLSGLLRGRRGTEHAIDGHQAGERFVALSTTLIRVALDLSAIGATRHYKGVAFGGTLRTPAQTVAGGGEALTPYAPVHLTAQLVSGGDLQVDWVRRTRIGGAWRDRVGVPVAEETEKYEVDLFDAGGSQVGSTQTVTGPTATFGNVASNDSPANVAGYQVKVYQISAEVGRGHPGELTL